MSKLIKADFRAFGAIGFQRLWCEQKQRICRQEQLLTKIIEQCIESDIHVLGINTEDDRVSRGFPEDRFGFLAEQAEIFTSARYRIRQLRDDSMVISHRENGKLLILNTQTAHPYENEKMLRHLVIGSNKVPNGLSLKDTINYCADRGLPNFLMHGGELSEEERLNLWNSVVANSLLMNGLTGVIGHEAQYCWPKFLSGMPVIGKYNRGQNERTQQFAKIHRLPCVAVSSSHTLEDIGRASILFRNPIITTIDEIQGTEADIFDCGETKLFETLQLMFKKISFMNNAIENNYESTSTWLSWALKLRRYGGKPDRFVGEKSSYNLPRDETFYNFK